MPFPPPDDHAPADRRAAPHFEDRRFDDRRFDDLRFDDPDGVDQVANVVRQAGWTAFERPLPRMLVAAARFWPGVMLDVGSNTGFYAMLAAAAHPRNRVLAFEPVAAIAAIARRNAELNGLSDRIAVVPQAIGDRNGTATLFIPPGDHGMVETSASLDAGFKTGHMRRDLVPVRRLDRAFDASPWCWSEVTMVKVDVEGYEAEVLDGASFLLRLHRPVVFVEMLERAGFARMNALLSRRRYVPFRLRAGSSPIRAATLAFDPESWNHALVPAEKAEAFAAFPA